MSGSTQQTTADRRQTVRQTDKLTIVQYVVVVAAAAAAVAVEEHNKNNQRNDVN